jgi:broad specificity phosphatase PhoE
VAHFNDPLAGRFEHSPVTELNEWLSNNGPDVPTRGAESQQDAMRRYVMGYETLMSRQEEVILAVIHRLPIVWLLTAIEDADSQEIDFAVPISLEAVEVQKAVAVLRSDPIQAAMSY